MAKTKVDTKINSKTKSKKASSVKKAKGAEKKVSKKKVSKAKKAADVPVIKADNSKASCGFDKKIICQKFLIILIAILAIAAIFAVAKMMFGNGIGSISLSGELAARVNGDPITMERLDTEYDRLPASYQQSIPKDLFLEQMISEMLIIDHSAKLGFSVSEEDIDANLGEFVGEYNISDDELAELLEENSLTEEQLRKLIANQLLIDKVLEKEVIEKATVSSDDALAYYKENTDVFKVPQLVTARHIMISSSEISAEEARAKAESVMLELDEDNSNFCDLVTKYSEDAASVDECGEYIFSKGQMPEDFEELSFSQGEGEVGIADTDYGSHIIMTMNITPETIISFSDVEEQIMLVLQNQKQKSLYSELILKLKEDASIKIYYTPEMDEEESEPNLVYESTGSITVTQGED